MPKPSDLTPKQRHDIERQSRAHIVRLDEEEQSLALKAVAKRKDVTSIGGLLRHLLREHLGLGPKARKGNNLLDSVAYQGYSHEAR